MVRINVCDIEEINNNNMELLMSVLSDEQKGKVLRYRCEGDRQRCLIGLALTGMVFGKRPCELKMVLGQHEKPFVMNGGGVHYNLSHSGRYVVIASGGSSLGIDVEKVGRVKKNIAKRLFSPRENVEYRRYRETDGDFFCRMWTLKECYIKYDGRGLTLPLNSFSILPKGEGYYMEDSRLKFRQFDMPDGYIMSVCSEEEIENSWQKVNVERLCGKFK